MFWRVASVVLALQAGVSTAVVNNNCEGDDRTKIEDGLADAIKMANSSFYHLRPTGAMRGAIACLTACVVSQPP